IGAILGNLGCYGIGYWLGTDRFKVFRSGKGLASVERTRKGLETRGLGLIVAARWIPVARIAIIMTVGAMKYPFRKFVLGSIASLTMWGLNILAIGTIFGNIPQLPPWLAVVAGIVTGLLVGMLLDRLVRWGLARHNSHPNTATAA
ncbi:MAG: VTT domain-containing protein, partial [Promicromonosporaceae bacterium]|nr:VTT domain-containing protein [Promicromonosporaceae bacterium]